MERKSKLKAAAAVSYIVTAVLFIIFAVYMLFCENNKIYNARENESYAVVDNYTVEEIEDPSAPAGIRKEYSWELENAGSGNDCLIFYLVHHYAEVRLDGELVYSLMPGDSNRIGGSPSSNWVIVPLYASDNGCRVQVTVYPAYSNVVDREIKFKIGSEFDILINQLKSDLPKILLSSLCIVIGLLIFVIQLYRFIRKNIFSLDIFYLGNFLLLIGIWKISDTRFSPIMFPNNPMALGYITIGALFLAYIPLLLFMKENYVGIKKTVLLVTALVGCAIGLSVLALQVFGISELRENLTINHIMLIVCIILLLFVAIYNRRKEEKNNKSIEFIALTSCGVLGDLLYFYIYKSSSGILFTILTFLIYATLSIISAVYNINRQAHTDEMTGLLNRRRWDETIEKINPSSNNIGMIMLDLNGLKRVNDSMGHDMGDKMILNFANILRNAIPSEHTICRWGGDEFTVMTSGADFEKMEGYIKSIADAVEKYNASEEKPKIYYSAGYALYSEFPEISCNELLEKADERMYMDKHSWYDGENVTVSE